MFIRTITMNSDITTGSAVHLTGYAWHAYPDPATDGVFAGDNPFGAEDTPGLDRAITEPPAGVRAFYLLNKNTPGISNQTEGHSFLILTESAQPPSVVAGWTIEVAHLSDNFELDQRGDRAARLVRVLGAVDTPHGKIKHCEFQVDRG